MIEVRVRFWTDSIAPNRGEIVPKHALTGGTVNIAANAAHGITPNEDLKFNSLLEIPSVVEQCLIEHGITLVAFGKMKKYLLRNPPQFAP